jgi:cytochrome c biogenesis protein CcmG, thiol:disulfide interchange protein DsbE
MQMRKSVVVALMVVAVVSCKRGEKATYGYSDKTNTSATSATGTQPETAGSAERAEAAAVGTPMPAYTATYLDGTKFDMADRRKNVVLLNVWATWCGPCVFEIPELQQLHEQYGPRGFEVIGASLDEGGADEVRQFIADQKKMTYPIVLDPEGKIAALLETGVLPTTVLVDRSGRIVWKKYGAIMSGDEELKKAIEKAVGG